jgi:hypothetical protein
VSAARIWSFAHTDPSGTSVWDTIAGLDNPVSQAIAGALNGALANSPAKLFGFDPACVGGAFDFGSTYLAPAVPFPGGKLATAEKLAAKTESRLWPKTAEEMDNLLGMEGKRVPDGPTTPGRNKVTWQPSQHTKITLEQHPYDQGSPIAHAGPHWIWIPPEAPTHDTFPATRSRATRRWT